MIIERLRFIWDNSEGKILDIGCEKGDVWRIFGLKDVTGLDCDNWNPYVKKFVQGFAEDLPFKDNEFDTVILGDILEHVKNVEFVLREAYRVSKNKIIVTVPDEYHYNDIKPFYGKKEALNPNIDPGGFELYNVSKNINSHIMDDDKFQHLWHVRYFTKSSLVAEIRKISKNYNISTIRGDWAFYCVIINKEKI